MYQVVIIGAGPVGGRLATELASRGISTLMIEEHAEIGRPFQCAGLVNPPAMQMVGLEDTICKTSMEHLFTHLLELWFQSVRMEGFARMSCVGKIRPSSSSASNGSGAHL